MPLKASRSRFAAATLLSTYEKGGGQEAEVSKKLSGGSGSSKRLKLNKLPLPSIIEPDGEEDQTPLWN